VVVKEDGRVPSTSELSGKKGKLYDEVVIPQESQIMPVWVLRLDLTNKGEMAGFSRFKRRKSKKSKSKLKRGTGKKNSSSNDLV
jgi:hypothetical protein